MGKEGATPISLKEELNFGMVMRGDPGRSNRYEAEEYADLAGDTGCTLALEVLDGVGETGASCSKLVRGLTHEGWRLKFLGTLVVVAGWEVLFS